MMNTLLKEVAIMNKPVKDVTLIELQARVDELVAAGFELLDTPRNKEAYTKLMLVPVELSQNKKMCDVAVCFKHAGWSARVHLIVSKPAMYEAPTYHFLVNDLSYPTTSAIYKERIFRTMKAVIERATELGEAIALKHKEAADIRKTVKSNAVQSMHVLKGIFGDDIIIKHTDKRGSITAVYRGYHFNVLTELVLSGQAVVEFRIGGGGTGGVFNAEVPRFVSLPHAKILIDTLIATYKELDTL
jgi:hypothetical protein